MKIKTIHFGVCFGTTRLKFKIGDQQLTCEVADAPTTKEKDQSKN
jgi:hypothetical protein